MRAPIQTTPLLAARTSLVGARNAAQSLTEYGFREVTVGIKVRRCKPQLGVLTGTTSHYNVSCVTAHRGSLTPEAGANSGYGIQPPSFVKFQLSLHVEETKTGSSGPKLFRTKGFRAGF